MRFLREPLLHFVVLGAALFLVHAVASDVFSTDASRRIAITEPEIELLAGGFGRQWQRPPTEDELRALVDGRVREEVLYREALAVGLDQNDVIVRRRMVQKMELLSQDLATLADPRDQELRAFFQERQEEYRVPPRISFSHVYFNTDRRGPAAEEDARRALAELRAATPPPRRAPERGDRFMLQHDYALRSPLEVQQLFGARFAERLFELELGWYGPVVSGYGIHLVYVGERVEGRIPEYEEVRDRLVNDYNRMRRDRANELLYEGLVRGYEVEIDEEALRRAALRVGSGTG
jgi:hypothetical protein